MEFKLWRFNLRSSNTESLIRLNMETRGDKNLLHEKLNLIKKIYSKDGQNFEQHYSLDNYNLNDSIIKS